MSDQWTDRLSEYLDGELPAAERAALDAHLARCADCRATLGELRAVVARARALEDRAPATDLWPGIEAQLTGAGARAGARRVAFSMPQLAAAAVALILVTAGGMWLALRQDPAEVALTPAPSEMPQLTANATWTARTDLAVAELQEALAQNESRLDTATVRVVRQNLAIIDRAIDQAQQALRNDPGNAYLNLHLANTMRRKIELLRRANALAAAES